MRESLGWLIEHGEVEAQWTVLQVEGRLAVREEVAAFLVVREEDPDDWLARFEKDGDFPAANGPRTWPTSTTGAWPAAPRRTSDTSGARPASAILSIRARCMHSSRERISEREGPL